MRSSDVFKLREDFQGAFGSLPSEVAPRLLLIGDFPAGRSGLNSLPPGSGLSLGDVMREYGDGNADYNLDYAKTFASRSYNGIRPAGFDIYNVKPADATFAQSAIITDAAVPSAVDLFRFKAIGPGAAYNSLTVKVTIRRIVASHPAGNNTAVCDVEVQSPNPDASPELFEGLVFTYEGGTAGASGLHRTRNASVMNDPVMGSRYVRLEYQPTAATSTINANRVAGDSVTATLTGATNGSALSNSNWEAAIDAVSGIAFRWFTIANPPSTVVRAYLHNTLKTAPFRLVFLNQMYGETLTDFINDTDTYGDGPGDGTGAKFFGWGAQAAVNGREVPASAAYLGEWSAKISANGLGGSYPVGNSPLGFRSISVNDNLTKGQMDAAAAAGVNYLKQLDSGAYGVHGYYTLDDQLDRMGDLGVRSIINDIGRRLAIAFTPLAHNRPNNAITRGTIQRLGDQAIMPYVNSGAVKRASTGTFDLMEVQNRWQGVSFPSLPGWAVFMASIKLNGTLGGVFAHLTDAEIEGLTSIAGGAPAAPAAAAGGN